MAHIWLIHPDMNTLHASTPPTRQRRAAPWRWALPLLLVLPLLAQPLVGATPSFKVLVFSKTAGFRHASIANGIQAIQELGAANNFAVDTTEDGAAFTDANLAQYQAVIFLSTTGNVLDSAQQAAFERFIGGGRGYVGIHAASDTEYSWPWYGGLVGAYFKNHPAIQTATIVVEDRTHPSTAGLPERWTRRDEWYNFQTNPRGRVQVLARLDESSYSGGDMGDHPIAWYHRYSGGRAWYTGGGHTAESFEEAQFRQHLLGGILWAAGASSTPTPTVGPTTTPTVGPTATPGPSLTRRGWLPLLWR